MTDPHPPNGPSPDPGGSPPAAAPALRRKADAAYRARTAGLPEPFEASWSEPARALVHELRVHQIELEMQNEELRRTQVELAATRARYFDLFDLAPVGYLLVRENGLILEANLTAAAMLGEVRGAISDRPVSRSIFPADQDAYYLCRKRLVDTGEPQSCELRVVKPGGAHLWVRVAMSAACADDRTPLHRVTLTDIGESKRAEAVQRESEERLRVALTAAAAIGFVWDAASDAVVRYFSTVPSLPVNVDAPEPVAAVRARVHPDDVGLFDAGVAECLGKGTAYRNLYRVVDPDGSERWLQEWGTLSRDAAGRPLRLTGISIDVTDRKRAEAALRESEERFRAMADAAPVLIWMADTTRRCVWFNSQWLEFVGREMARETGDGWVENVHADDVDRCFAIYAEAFAARRPFTMEYRLRRHDGEYRWLLDTGVPRFDAGGEFAGYIGSCVDVTERKRSEDALRASEAKFRSFMEFSPILAWIVSPDGRFLFANHGFARLLKTSTEEVERSTVEDMFPPEYAAEYLANNRRVLEAARPIETIERSTRQDGTEGVFLAYKFPMPTPDGSRQIFGVAVDISEQKRFEYALRQSEERLRLALEAGRMGIFDWDLATNAVVWSDTHYELMGYPAGARLPVEYRHFIDRIHPDDRSAIERALRATMETGAPYQPEARVLLPDGTIRWVVGNGEFQYDSEGRPVRMLGTISDITDRKQAEEALLVSEARARAVINSSPVPMAMNDDAQRITFLNLAFIRTFGYELADIPTLADWWPKAYPDPAYRHWVAEAWQAELTRSAQTGTAFAMMDLTIRCKDGTDRFVAANATALADTFAGTCLVVLHDITKRKQADAELLMRDRAIQAVNQGIVITDPNLLGDPIVYVSPGFESMTGYTSAEVVGRNCRFLQGPDTDRAQVARIAAAVWGGVPYSCELLNYRKDGSTFWNELSITPVRDPDGRLVHFVGIQTDVTARRSLEDQLRQAQKMEAVGQLAGGVAHDFNNLLTIIHGYTGMLLDAITPADHSWEFLQEIRTASERAADLTGRLLTFGRRQIRNPEPLDLNSVVDETIKLLGRLLGDDVELDVLLDPHLKWVWADRGQISQILLNLAINARDSMSGGGLLSVRTENLELTESRVVSETRIEPGHYTVLSVTDTGCGMAAEVLARVFEPFFTTKPVGKGTGLGLATVHGIVRQMEGGIEILSEVGTGTSSRVYLPGLPPTYDSVSASSESQEAVSGSETILLVEDDHALRKVAHLMLASHGYIVLEAAGGSAALQVFSELEQSIQLLITDIGMSGMNGIELAEQIIARKPSIRVLFMSGYVADKKSRDHFLRPEVSFLQKPFSSSELLQKVKEVMDS